MDFITNYWPYILLIFSYALVFYVLVSREKAHRIEEESLVNRLDLIKSKVKRQQDANVRQQRLITKLHTRLIAEKEKNKHVE